MKKLHLLRVFTLIGAVLAFLSCSKSKSEKESESGYTQFVNPLIGSGDHGHVFVGANVPFGAVQLGPAQIDGGWD